MNEYLTPNPDDKLEDALALLMAGIPVAEILAEAGDDAEWLRPLLEISHEVGDLQATVLIPPPNASLRRMLDYGQELAGTSSSTSSLSSNWRRVWGWLSGGWLPRLATGLITAALMMVFLGGTMIVLAQRSLPGQPLYALKRAGETLRLDLTQDPAEHERLRETYNQLRRQETQLLLEQGQTAQVAFEGHIEALTGSTLILDGLAVQLTPQTKIEGNLIVGAKVRLAGLTQPPGQLVALTLTVIETPPPPPPPPAPTSTPTPTPGQSQATDTLKLPTATATPTSRLSQATDTLRLPTATPTHTSTPLPPPPTATPTVVVIDAPPTSSPLAPGDSDSGSEDQGGGDDNTNDNGGDANTNDNTDDNPGGDDNSGSDGGSDDHSGSGSSGSDSNNNSESDSSGDDHSGSESSGSDSSDNSGSDSNGGNSGNGGGDDNSGDED